MQGMEAGQAVQPEDRTTLLEEQIRTLQTEISALKSKSRVSLPIHNQYSYHAKHAQSITQICRN
jgi:hypothetical protein